MSKRNSDGDVLFNRLAVGVAQEQNLLTSLLGGDQEAEPQNEMPDDENDDEDLKYQGDDEQFGVGAKIPKDIENGTFTRRVPTSDDKLLQQLIGKKAARAHLDARQASKHSAKMPGQKHSKPQATPKKEESEDEEEGRASAFKSKKRKTAKTQPVGLKIKELEINDNVAHGLPTAPDHHMHDNASKEKDGQEADDESDGEDRREDISKYKHQQSKPASYLDQLLAERSKKKKKKSKSKAEV